MKWRSLVRKVGSPYPRLSRRVARATLGVTASVIVTSWSLWAASPPASANTIGPVIAYEANSSSHWRVGAPSLALYAQVRETRDGRYLDQRGVSGGLELVLDAKKSLCVAAADNGSWAVLHACNGGLGVVWIEQPDGIGHKFESREFSGRYLAGDGHGDQFQLKKWGTPGWYYQFVVELVR